MSILPVIYASHVNQVEVKGCLVSYWFIIVNQAAMERNLSSRMNQNDIDGHITIILCHVTYP